MFKQGYLVKNILPIVLIVIITGILFLYKLNYESFFTDEILYTNSGYEYVNGEYSLSLQHPLITKYIAGFMMLIDERDVFILRLPFALLGVGSVIVVYLILNSYFDKKYAFAGGLLFALTPYIYTSTRMVMMEAPMHFFWLLFHMFFLRFITQKKLKDAIFSGIFIGLGMATKYPTAIIYIFIPTIYLIHLLTTRTKLTRTEFYKLATIYITSVGAYALTYTDLVLKNGFQGLVKVAQVTKDVFVGRNEEGKDHVVGNVIYHKSPWWYYFYFFAQKYSPVHLFITAFSPVIALIEKSFFSIYWLVFLVYIYGFFQMIPLKNERYISSIELPLIFLIISGSHFVITKLARLKQSWLSLLIATIILAIAIPRIIFVYSQTPTKYYALERYLVEKTKNFTNGDRTYIMGSIRSSRWQFENVAPDLVVSRKDFDIMFPEFPDFKYIVFDNIELLKNTNNELTRFVKFNVEYYDKDSLPGLTIYIKKDGAQPPLRK